MKRIAMIAVASTFLTLGGISAAAADDCSGHDHSTGTAVGVVGGAAIGGLASHSIVGAVVGGVVGGVAGNAIDRSQDCEHQANQERARDQAYNDGYSDRAVEDHAAANGDPRPLNDPNADVQVYRDRDVPPDAVVHDGRYPGN